MRAQVDFSKKLETTDLSFVSGAATKKKKKQRDEN